VEPSEVAKLQTLTDLVERTVGPTVCIGENDPATLRLKPPGQAFDARCYLVRVVVQKRREKMQLDVPTTTGDYLTNRRTERPAGDDRSWGALIKWHRSF